MHVTSVVCDTLCVCVSCLQCRRWMSDVRLHSCRRAAFTLGEPCYSCCSRASPRVCSAGICWTSKGIYIFNSLLGLCTITDSDGMFPECPRLWCAKPTQTRALVSVIDYCCLTRTLRLVFPLNLCPLPLLLLPGLGLAVYVRVSVSWHL